MSRDDKEIALLAAVLFVAWVALGLIVYRVIP